MVELQNTTLAAQQVAFFTCEQVLNATTTNTGTVRANYPGGQVVARDTVTVETGTHYIYLPGIFVRYP